MTISNKIIKSISLILSKISPLKEKLMVFRDNKYDKIFPILIFVISFILFWVTEDLVVLRYIFLSFSLLITFIYILNKEKEWIIFFSYFYMVFSLLNCLDNGFLSLSLIMAFLLLIIILLSFQLVKNFTKDINKQWFYTLLFSICNLEILFSILFWPINNQSKSLLILTFFYLSWGVLDLRMNNKLFLKQILPFLSLTTLVLISIILSARWIGY